MLTCVNKVLNCVPAFLSGKSMPPLHDHHKFNSNHLAIKSLTTWFEFQMHACLNEELWSLKAESMMNDCRGDLLLLLLSSSGQMKKCVE